MKSAISIALVLLAGGCKKELAGSYAASFDETIASDGADPAKTSGGLTVQVMRGENGVVVTFSGGSILADACALEAARDETESSRATFATSRSCSVKLPSGDAVMLRVTGGAIERTTTGSMKGEVVGDLWGMPGFPANTPSARYTLDFRTR